MVANDPWLTHRWLIKEGRRVTDGRGRSLTLRFCFQCGRHFIEDPIDNERYAVSISLLDFDRLADEVSARWLNEPCPGYRPASDSELRKMRHASG